MNRATRCRQRGRTPQKDNAVETKTMAVFLNRLRTEALKTMFCSVEYCTARGRNCGDIDVLARGGTFISSLVWASKTFKNLMDGQISTSGWNHCSIFVPELNKELTFSEIKIYSNLCILNNTNLAGQNKMHRDTIVVHC